MPTNGTITFKDAHNNFSTMQFNPTVGMTELTALAAFLETKSDCPASKASMIESVINVVDGAGNRDRKAIITCTDQDNSVHKWALPGFNGVSETDNDGEKVEATELRGILDAIEAVTGYSLAPLRSPVIQTR